MAEISSKERLLNAITGKEIDRVPWSPFLAYYWDKLPAAVQKKGQLSYLLEMGADPLLRGFLNLFDTEIQNCSIRQTEHGNKRYEILETKVGTLTKEFTYSPAATHNRFRYKYYNAS